ncbi:MAG: hypothetical protein HRT98_04440 [Mycoplasmatales bacterium]|nr:hypothetical protein [Mycoplasmatales bacterium]
MAVKKIKLERNYNYKLLVKKGKTNLKFNELYVFTSITDAKWVIANLKKNKEVQELQLYFEDIEREEVKLINVYPIDRMVQNQKRSKNG